MKFRAYADGYRVREFDSLDADDAAQEMAEYVFNCEAGDTPRDEYDVTVMDPDGNITRHAVTLEFSPTFSAWAHDDEPSEGAVSELRADRRCAAGDSR